jgi:hypothetical protein
MTDGSLSVFVQEMDIAQFQAMLKLDIDDEKRTVVERLLKEAKLELVQTKERQSKHRDARTAAKLLKGSSILGELR